MRGVSKQYYEQNFEAPVKNLKLKRALKVLRKFVLRIRKSYLKQDFASWFEREAKGYDERLEIKNAGEVAVA